MTKYFIILISTFQIILAEAQTLNNSIQTDNKLKTSLDTTVHSSAINFFSDGTKAGLSIGIYVNGKTFYYNYGTAEKEKQALPTNKTIYEIGSISKTFTGTLLAKAVIDKKLNMDDDIRKYLDGNYPNLAYQSHPIKIAHLLSHISGLPNFLPDSPQIFKNPNYDSLPFIICNIQNNYTRELFFEDLHRVVLDTIPGYQFSYSNAGAQLLKYILEKQYKKSYDRILKDEILRPLNMPHTYSQYAGSTTNKVAIGYSSKGNIMPYNPPMLDAAGGILSTSADMITYLKYHLNEANPTVALTHKVVFGSLVDYAIGINWQACFTKEGRKKIWQSGGTFGFGSYCVAYPGHKVAIVLLSNESDPGTQAALERIADTLVEVADK